MIRTARLSLLAAAAALSFLLLAPAASTHAATRMPAAPHASSTRYVSIYNGYYTPRTIYITAGTTVVWTNYGAYYHTVTNYASYFYSYGIAPGGTYSRTFSYTGTYYYYDRDSSATGMIVVS